MLSIQVVICRTVRGSVTLADKKGASSPRALVTPITPTPAGIEAPELEQPPTTHTQLQASNGQISLTRTVRTFAEQ
jgi:hypothetical protein